MTTGTIAELAKYGLEVRGLSDALGKQGRQQVERLRSELPAQTRYATAVLAAELDAVQRAIASEHCLPC